VNLISEKERVSRTGECRPGREAQANWHKNVSDSAIAVAPNYKEITTCSESQGSPNSYRIIRKKCARNQVTTSYYRSRALPAKPLIAQAVAYSHDTAVLTLAEDPKDSTDAPVAFYTITATKVNPSTESRVETQRVYSWRDLRLVMSGLQSLTTYTLTITATTIDGTSPVSIASMPITTAAYVAPTSNSSNTLTAPAFTLSKVAETTTAFTSPAGFGYTISSTGGAIASYALTGSLPAGLTFSTATGLITGEPTETKTATTYTITGTNALGSASATYRLRVTGDIGDVGPGGGRIYYYLASGFSCGPTRAATCKYLEVAPNTWNGGAADPQKAVLSSRDDGVATSGMDSTTAISFALVTAQIGAGYLNSNALASRANSNSVGAGLVGTYRGGSQSDWYIPSAAELNLLCQWSKGLTQNVSGTCSGSVLRGDFTTSTYYWAASQNYNSAASSGATSGRFVGYVQSFNTGSFVTDQWADGNIYLRPIRAF
jgi:hypothetical protein